MQKPILTLVVLVSAGFASCQYEQGAGSYQHGNRPPSNILLHKQALGQDGSFNYAFAADNGLQQGEIINPDGSRKGSYSYVDPNGKTVTLSYTAGKDGFRVLNGDHVPKAPEPQRQRPQYYQQQQPQSQQYSSLPQREPSQLPLFRPDPVPFDAYRSAPGAPAYRGNPVPYEDPYRQTHRSQYDAAYGPAAGAPRPAFPVPHHQSQQYGVQEGSRDKPAYAPYLAQQFGDQGQEDPRKPHSFGNGYSFEFAG